MYKILLIVFILLVDVLISETLWKSFYIDLPTQTIKIRDIVIKHSFKCLTRYPQNSIGPSMMKVGMQLLQNNHTSHINKSYSAD